MLNCVIMVGRLTRDPELKTSQSGVNICNISIPPFVLFGGAFPSPCNYIILLTTVYVNM